MNQTTSLNVCFLLFVLFFGMPAYAGSTLIKDPGGSGSYSAKLAALIRNAWMGRDILSRQGSVNPAFAIVGPGGVAGASLWLRADAGTSSTTNNTAISAWTDYISGLNNAAQPTAANQPAYRNNSADNINFNPVIKFDGTSDRMLLDGTKLPVGTTARTVIAATASALTANRGLISWGDPVGANHGTRYTMEIGGGNRSIEVSFSRWGNTGGNTLLPGMTMFVNAAATTSAATQIRVNGAAVGNAQICCGTEAINTLSLANAYLGDNVENNGGGGFYNGLMGDVIVYPTALTTTEQQRVESYVAVKYGLTLNSGLTSYLATDGSTIWDATSNATYRNNITGIGRDDTEGLNQKQSRSVNTGAMVTMGYGGIAADNLSNTGNFSADISYLIFGDDGTAVTLSTALTGKTGINARLTRIWKVQESGTVGSVRLAVLQTAMGSAIGPNLVLSSDATFDGTDTFYPMTATAIDGINYLIADVDLSNAQYFSFAADVKAPGGVVGTSAWFRADAGTSSTTNNTAISAWADYASGVNNAAQATAANQPSYSNNTTDNINFNPVVKFDGTTDRMILDGTKLPLGLSARTIIAATANAATIDRGLISWGNTTANGQGTRYSMEIGGGNRTIEVSSSRYGNTGGNTLLPSMTMYIHQTNTRPSVATIRLNGAGAANAFVCCGNHIINTPSFSLAYLGDNVGNSGGNFYNGLMGDVIVYPKALSAAEQQRVESFLAVKYGLTMNSGLTDYLATDGSTIWNATTHAAYKTNIGGIGRDDTEGLNQKQSKSINTGAVLTAGLGAIAANNPGNANTFTLDKSYLTWGSNSAALTTTPGDIPVGSCIAQRLTQEWKTQLSNFDAATHPLRLQFDLTGIPASGVVLSDYRLLIDLDGDGNFATGTVTQIPATDFSAGVVGFSNVTALTNDVVFTLATSCPIAQASLVTDGGSKTMTASCTDGGTAYLIDPADASKYIAAIDLNGNTMDLTKLSVLVDVSRDMVTALGKNNGTTYGTQLMRRLLQITYTGAALNVNGGVKLRLLWNPAEKTNAETTLSGTRGVTGVQKWTWFKHAGDITATLADLSPEKLANITELTPSATGQVDGVDYVEFSGIQTFSTFGGVTTANQVLSIVKVADGTEGTANGGYSISLPAGVMAAEDVTVNYTMSGTAVNGTDYTSVNGTVVLLSGTNSIGLPVTVTDDAILEVTENVTATLTGGTGNTSGSAYGASGTAGAATLDIVDNDNTTANRVLSVVKTADGLEPGTNGAFAISLPAGVLTSENITVNYTIGGTATAGSDYATLTGSAVILAGQNGISVPVVVSDDPLIENSETVVLTLTNGSSTSFAFAASATVGVATLDIADEDNSSLNRVLSVVKTVDGLEPGTNGAFTISLPAGVLSSENITVNYTAGGAATPGSDYTALSGTAVILAGQNGISVPVVVSDDQLIENSETVVLTLTNGSSTSFAFTASATVGVATLDIADEDNSSLNRVLSVVKTVDGLEPGTNGAFTISLPAGVLSSENITVNYTVGGTATGGSDYTTLSGTTVILAGQNGVTVPVVVSDDQLIENSETVVLTLTNGSSASFAFTASATVGAATLDIADEDNTVSNRVLSVVKTADGAEPGTNGAFTISLPAGVLTSENITVNYTVGGTATAGSDYTTLTGTVVILAGQNGISVPVAVSDDQLIENSETVVLTLTNGSSASFAFTASAAVGSATVNIADEDNSSLNRVLSVIKTADGLEPGTNGAFTISLPAGVLTSENITVNYTVGGTATAGPDYTALSGTTVILAGQNGISVPVVVSDDQLIENSETVILTLTNGNSTSFAFTASATVGVATLDIADEDNSSLNRVLSVVKTADGAEPGTNGAFTISLPAGVLTSENITVNYTVGGTATAGSDYTALTGSVVILAGQNGISVPVVVSDDQLIENSETVVLTLTNGSSTSFAFSASATNGDATVNIADEDNTALNRVLSVVKTADGLEPGTNGAFAISLPAGVLTSENITVNYTVGGTTTAGSDYTTLSGTAVILAGQNGVSVPVVVSDDQLIENSETVVLTLTNGSSTSFAFAASATVGAATLDIADNDNTTANRALSVVKTADGLEPGTNGAFTISLPAGALSSENISVNYTVGGTATAGSDYTALTGTSVILAGQNGVSVPVVVSDDQLIENLETVLLTLTNGSSTSFAFTASASVGSATVNIVDEDNSSLNRVLSVVKTADGLEPGTNGAFAISLPAGVLTSENISVNYTVGGTATAGSDYTTLTGLAVILAGQNGVSVPVTVSDDQLIENSETVLLTLTNGSSASFAFTASATNGDATVNIADEDNSSLNRVLSVVKTVDGLEPGTNGAFTISLPAGVLTSENITVNYTVGGTATAGSDYTALSGTAVILAGQNGISVPVVVSDDQLIENSETVLLTLTNGSSASFAFTASAAVGNATVNIADEDNSSLNRVLSVVKTADGLEPGTNGAFAISLPAGVLTSENITVNYTVGGTATAGSDYTALSGTAVILAGQNGISVPVVVSDDQLIENSETVVLTLTNGSSTSFAFTASATVGAAVLDIADNDYTTANRVLSVVKTADGLEPGNNGTFTISLPAGVLTSENITVNYAVGGTATAGSDYTALSGTTVILAGQNGISVPVVVSDDPLIENSETVVLTLTNGNSISFAFTASAAVGSATVNIGDEDNSSLNRVLSVVKTADGLEPGSNGAFTISLPAGVLSSENITVNYIVAGTATAGSDYITLTGSVVILAGQNGISIPVNVTDDKIIEGNETVILNLSSGSSTSFAFTASGTNGNATLNIADDEGANRVLNIVKITDAAEPGTNGSFSISLPAGITAASDITVSYTIGGTAINGSDYASLTGTSTITAGQNNVVLALKVNDDLLIEGNETVVLTLTGGTARNVAFTASGTASANIMDDDLGQFVTWKTVATVSGAAKANAAEELIYTIHVKNTGNSAVPNISIADPVPANTSYVSGGSLNGNLVTFGMSNLVPGATATVSFRVRVNNELSGINSISNMATVSDGTTTKQTGACDPTLPGCSIQLLTVIPIANNPLLGISKSASEAVYQKDGSYLVTYTTKLVNMGDVPFTSLQVPDDLKVVFPFPVQFSLEGSVQTTGQLLANSGYDGLGSVNLLGSGSSIGVGQEATIIFTVRIRPNSFFGPFSNQVTASATGNGLVLTARSSNGLNPDLNADGIPDVASVTSLMLKLIPLKVPNVFTPNGDNRNETFVIANLELYPENELTIVSRWGNPVFERKNYKNDWAGTGLNEGTYFYVFKVKRESDKWEIHKGFITLLRSK